MPNPNPAATSVDLLLQLLRTISKQHESLAHLAELDPAALDHLYTKASDLHHRAIEEARDLLGISLESLEHSSSLEHQRRLIERADDELASAQR